MDDQPVDFALGTPALVCRWRLVGRTLPLLNRHMRALSQRTVQGAPVSRALVSWAKQHIEWSLADDTTVEVPADGVLMMVVDEQGHAAMTVGPYEAPDASAGSLAARARAAATEAAHTGIAPEVLCCEREGAVYVGAEGPAQLSGAGTLVHQLLETKGIPCAFDVDLVDHLEAGEAPGAWFLVSDEHGVLPVASDADDGAAHPALALCREGYQVLCDRAARTR